jgi:hypothetical protein
MGIEISDDLERNLKFLGISILLVLFVVGAKNVAVPDDRVEVGYTEVHTDCYGIDAGVCLGLERRDHTTYNYNNYTEVEPGTENFYRRVESELMLQAYGICDSSMTGMKRTDEAEYRNRTATERLENEQVDLLPCEKSFYRSLNATE